MGRRGSPVPTSSEVTRRLDFDGPSKRGKEVATVDYGGARRQVGFLPACRTGCPPPCPCSTPIQPAAFDLGSDGRLWILDNAKSRVAVFSPSGDLAQERAGGELMLRAADLQVAEDEAFVLSQNDRGRSRLLSFAGDGERKRSPVTFEGLQAEAYRLWVSGPRLFTTVFSRDGLSDEEVPVEISRAATGEAAATRVPGRPFLDGWSLFQHYAGQRSIPLEVSSSRHRWRVTIELELVRSNGAGEAEARRGHVSWESEISPDGAFHLLLFAGTEGRNPVDGYWYLTVSAAGDVSGAVRLRGPTIRDDQQSRRLSLDGEGRPIFMWAARRGLRIEHPPAETS